MDQENKVTTLKDITELVEEIEKLVKAKLGDHFSCSGRLKTLTFEYPNEEYLSNKTVTFNL